MVQLLGWTLAVGLHRQLLFARCLCLDLLGSFSGFQQKHWLARPTLMWLMLQWGIRPSNSRCFSFCTSLESLDFLSSSHKTALTEGRRQYQHPLSQFSIWNLFRGRIFHFLFSFVFFPLKAFICHLLICLFSLWFLVLWANTAGY